MSMSTLSLTRRQALFTALAAVAPTAAIGQDAASAWPTRTITLVVPFAAGGALDLPARRLAAEISPKLGHQIVIDNRAGANGNIGAAFAAKADPDGYTFLFGSPGVLATNRFMYKSMPFDADRAFVPVILLAKSPLVIAASPKLPVHNLQELIAYAKAHPGKINVGTPGVGAQAHLTMELLQRQTGTVMTYVPYRGGSNILGDLVSGQVDLTATYVPAIIGALKENMVRGLFITTLERSKQLPDVPTAHESGVPGFESVAWYSIVAPAGTPQAIIAKLNGLINDYLKSDLGRQQFESLDLQPVGGSPTILKNYIEAETAKWGPVIKAAGIAM
jgi:tripartite-type tricarboxylate transporter receptor subunit TctC